MDKIFDFNTKEKEIYKIWESINAFSPEGACLLRKSNNKPYSVLMPPPNANAPLHCGHATYAIQDIMIRFKRMQGFDALYFPGTDHAGFETQVVYERKLKRDGKSRFDFDRESLYNQILDFVKENADTAINQLKQIGMSADWNRNTFMLDQKVIDIVYHTFEKMYKDNLVYRSGYMVNYSSFHGTTFSDLETEYKDSISPLFYVKYLIKGTKDKYITVATVRPETIYADVAIAINPNDKKLKKSIANDSDINSVVVINPLNGKEMPVIEDEYVDIKFGTGALKITPGHDINDYKIGNKHNLEIISLIDLDGKMNAHALECKGMYPKEARKKVREILEMKNAIEKIDENYSNRLLVDYKDGLPIEPMVIPNWFLDTNKLFETAIESIEKNEVKFFRPLWKKEILRWIKERKPWPISRQTVFGIRIPAWYDINKNPDLVVTFIDQSTKYQTGKISEVLERFRLEEVKNGLQKVIAPADAEFVISDKSPGIEFLPETDTFDTWFSSGLWPLTTTGFPDSNEFQKFFPTDFLDSMWDIMFFWIARMIMFSKYLTGKVPFKTVYFHGAVTDDKGQKMSKSKGNVIDPLDLVKEYGADALRMALVAGGDTSARFTPLSLDKVRGYRNFANKVWNIARYIKSKGLNENFDYSLDINIIKSKVLNNDDLEVIDMLNSLVKNVTKYLEKYQFKYAGEAIYQFIWEDFANNYLEKTKSRNDENLYLVINTCMSVSLKLLHPYMPFITEAVWQELYSNTSEKYLIIASWPKA